MNKVIRFIGTLILLIGIATTANAQYPGWAIYKAGGKHVTALACEGNKLWVGTWGGLVCMDTTTGNMTFYDHANSGLPYNNITSIAVEGSVKWIGTWGGGLAKFDDANWTVYNESNSGLSDDYIYTIAIEGGTKWVGTFGGGVASYNELGVEEDNDKCLILNAELKISPNPFINKTNIKYVILASSKVLLQVYDISGRCVKTIVNEEKPAERYKVNFDARGLASGIYFITLNVGSYKETKKIVKLVESR